MNKYASSMRVAFVLSIQLCALFSARNAYAGESRRRPIILQDVRIFSGTGESIDDHMEVKIENGVITDVGRNMDVKGARVLKLQNRLVIPGLIDSHVHLKSIPGAVQRQDDKDATRKFFAQQMRSYLASGVTSVLDAAATPSLVRMVNDYSASGESGPTVYYLTPFVTPKGGYFSTPELRTSAYSDMNGPVGGSEDLTALFGRKRGQNEVGAKVTFEDGFGPVAVWRTFDKTMRDAILFESRQRGIPLFIHSMKEAMTAMALELRPRGLMHVGFHRGKPSAGLLRDLKASGASVVSTQAVFDMPLVEYETDRLNDAWVQALVPRQQLDTAMSRAAIDKWRETMVGVNTPTWISGFVVRMMTPAFYNEREIRSQRDATKAALKQMYDTGIPVVMGSDAGCWPLIPFMFHGVSSIREMEVMVEAGIPVVEVIRAATFNAARMIGVDSSVGSIAIGKSADLVVYDIDLFRDTRAMRRPAYVMKSGVIRTPDEWLHGLERNR